MPTNHLREDRIGLTRLMNNGLQATITAYRGAHDIDIQFSNGAKVFNKYYHDFAIGLVRCPMLVEYIEDYINVTNANTNPHTVFMIDLDDESVLVGKPWGVNGCGYVIRSHPLELLHRTIMKAKSNELVDHINHDTLDNRKQNLRLCTTAQNAHNSRISKHNTSGFKGVHFDLRSQRWIASIIAHDKRIQIGSYVDKIDAVIARNEAAIKYHKEFAWINRI